ncbi:MAG: hypothetical protein CBC42_05170 [Betaproteobacteria bacterium TMED82]|nr:MAG: hypothetical protein CBC42_05170 [Betaproteobacteria bacterium TMED82]|tara:strand:- start:93110 stop:94147 length:1038 start_codon:yes stop_codon:yes gene_type:complete
MVEKYPTIAWLISNLKTNDFSELFETELASTRMRAGVCVSACIEAGKNILPPNYREAAHDPDIVFMAKFVFDSNTGQYLDDSGTRRDFWLKKIKALNERGNKLLLDYTDNHFSKAGVVGDFYREIKKYVSGLVLPSEKMKMNIASEWQKYTFIIPEPVEVDMIPPGNRPNQQITALWFGHVSNIAYLFDFMAKGMHKAPPNNLIILTNNFPKDAVQQAAKLAPKGVKIQLAQWTIKTMIQAAKISNYVIIPSSKNDPRKSGVSPGRLLTSLALGLPVIAEPLHSYLPFNEFFATINSDDSVNLAKNPNSQIETILAGQKLIEEKYTVEKIQKEWLRVIDDFSTSK